jgi:hypothetical protein
MRFLKYLGIFFGVLVVAVIAVIIYVATLDVGEYREDIATAVKDATGRDIRLSGDMNLELGRNLRLVIEDVGFANAEWGSRPEMAKLKQLELIISVIPLLSKNIVIPRVVMIEPDVLLETNDKGVGNWILQPPTEETADAKADTAGGTDVFPVVDKVTLRGATFAYKDGQTGELHEVKIEEMSGDREPGNLLLLALKAEWNGQAIAANGVVGQFDSLLPGEPYPMDLTINFAGIDVTLKGQIDDPIAVKGIDLAVGVKAASLEGLVPLAGDGVSHIKDIDLQTQVKGDLAAIELKPLNLKLAESDLSGSVSLGLAGERPAIKGKLASKRFDVAALLPPAPEAAEPAPKAEKATRVFPTDPLVLDGMKAVDAEIEYRGEEVVVPALTLKPMAVFLELKGGRLNVEPLEIGVAGSTILVKAKVDGAAAPARIMLDVKSKDLNMQKLLAEMDVTDLLEGTADVDVEVSGSGASVADIMASLNGHSLILMGEGRAKTAAFDTLIGGVSQIVGSLFSEKSEWTVVECIASNFEIKKGLATSKGMLFDTEYASVIGEGTINLGSEELDMKITPKPKSATLNVSVPIKVQGTFLEPSFKPDELATVGKLASLLGSLAFPPAALLAFGDLGGEDHPCVKSAEEASEESAAAPKSDSGGAGGAASKAVEGVSKGLKSLFGTDKKDD